MKIEDFLSQFGIPTVHAGEHHHARPGWLNLDCPFCSPRSGKFRLGYNLYGKYFNCWTCGPQRVDQTLSELTGQSFAALKKEFNEIERDDKWKVADRRGQLKLPLGLHEMTGHHRNYLRERDYNPAKLEKLWKLQGFGPVAGMYTWRLFIPYYIDDALVSWTSRATAANVLQRYLSAPPDMEVFSPKKFLYGEDYCKGSLIVICEGCPDVWRLGPGAVAIMGLGYSRAQLNRMARYTKRVIVFDSDKPGQRRAQMLCDELSGFPGETLNVTLDAADPGSASRNEVKRFWATITS